MAFHPFHLVRKYQRPLMALAAVLCMVVFILQFGSGDIFSKLGIGRGRNQGDKVVTLYPDSWGDKRDIYSADVTQMRQSRQLANELVLATFAAAEPKAAEGVLGYKPDAQDAEPDLTLTMVRESWGRRNSMMEVVNEHPEFINFIGQQFQSYPTDILRDYDTLSGMEKYLAGTTKLDPAKAKDATRMLSSLRFLLKFQYLQSARFNPSIHGLYFGGGVNTEELLDFEIWKHQAEKLGVVLTKADVRRALAFEAGGAPLPADPGGSWKDDPDLKKFFEGHGQATEDQVVTAITDEFRVEIARNLLAGRGAGVAALGAPDLTPDPATPYDFWTYYRDNRTSLQVAFLPIPVQSFESQVTAGIDSADLDAIYKQGQAQVPNPNSPTPGFRKPHRMRIMYLTAATDSPYYKDALERVQFNRERCYFSAGLPGAAGPWGALAAAWADKPLLSEYDRTLADRRERVALAGEVFGLGCGGLSALSSQAAVLQASADWQKEQATRFAALVAAPAGAPLGGLARVAVPATLARDLDLAAANFWQEQRKQSLSQIVQDDLTEFNKALTEKIKSAREEAEKNKDEPEAFANARADAFIREQAQKHGWTLTESSGLHDIYDTQKEIQEDKAFQPLREAWAAWWFDRAKEQHQLPPPLVPFSEALFKQLGPGLYQPFGPLSEADQKQFLMFWRTQDEAEQPRSYDDALNDGLLRAAWLKQQARILAQKKAQEINKGAQAAWAASQTGSQGQHAELERFWKEQNKDHSLGDLKEISGIARLVLDTPDAGIDPNYRPYVFALPDIPDNTRNAYDPKNLVNRLLKLDSEGKTTLIFTDQPVNTFYVAVVEQRHEPRFEGEDSKQFNLDYEFATRQPQRPGWLWHSWFLPKHKADYQKALMRQLREDAVGKDHVNEQGQIVLSDAAQKQQQGTPNEPEGGDDQ